MAPELCKEEEYDYKVDVWAAGILTYVLLAGSTPFGGRTKEDVYYEVCTHQPDMTKLSRASEEAKEFIKACLQKKPADRPSAQELLKYQWFNRFQRQNTNLSDNQ